MAYDESKLLTGHHLKVTKNAANFVDYKVFAQKSNDFTYEILDDHDLDVSSYYTVTPQFGVLSITARSIKLTAQSQVHDFSYTSYACDEYDLSGDLGYTDRVVVETYPTFSPGIYNNATISHNYSIIHDDTGEDVTYCYNINKINGTFTVNTISIDVGFLSTNTVEYDGYFHPIYDLEDVTVTGLPAEYKYVVNVLAANSMRDYQEDGYALNRNLLNVRIYTNDEYSYDVTDYFNINYTFGTSYITKKNLTITVQDYERDYNGYNLSNDLYMFPYITDGLVSSDYVSIKQMVNDDTANAGTGDLILSYYVNSSEDGRDVANNYNITINNASYTINRVPITIQLSDISKTFDGNDTFSYPSYYLSDGYLRDGDFFVNNYNSFNIGEYEPGYYEYSIPDNFFKIVHNSGNNDATGNYIINFVNSAHAYINKRSVTIRQLKSSAYYDKDIHGINNRNEFEVEGLASGHEIYFDPSFDFVDIGGYGYYSDSPMTSAFMTLFNPTIKDQEGRNVTSGYDFNFECDYYDGYGNYWYPFTISKKRIVVNSPSQSKIFDNTPLNPDEDYISYGLDDNLSLDDGDTVGITLIGDRPTHVNDTYDDTKNLFKYEFVVLDKNGNDVSDNYLIDKYFGNLFIYQCYLSISTNQTSRTYNGQSIGASESNFEVTMSSSNKGAYINGYNCWRYSELTKGYTCMPDYCHVYCELSGSSGSYSVGTYNFTAEFHVYDESSGSRVLVDESDVYLGIGSTSVVYNITKRNLSIKTDSSTITYNEKKPKPASEKRTVTGLASGDKIYFGNQEYSSGQKYYDSVSDKTTPGTYVNEVGPYTIKRGAIDVTNCYNITITEGTIRINS